MANRLPLIEPDKLQPRYYDALIASGLIDDIRDIIALAPRPVRLSDNDSVCHRGEPAHCLWVVVEGTIAVREGALTLFLRRRNEVVGEQNLLGNGCLRWYDLAVVEGPAELLVIEKSRIEAHPQRDLLWRNISKIISLKLREATRRSQSLELQVNDDTRFLHTHMNEYALSRRMDAEGKHFNDYKIDRAVVWFSDVVNFSRYILNLAPTRTADLVQRFFNAQTQPIQELGGHVDKFIGDGLMAFWVPSESAPVAGCCETALRAAEQAVAAVHAISIGPNALDLRIGLHTGLVLSGDFGSATRRQFTLIGPEVNKAARLEQVHSGDVCGGERTLGPIRISDEFRAELSTLTQRRYAQHSIAEAKNVGEVSLWH